MSIRNARSRALCCVVHLGFVGSRRLFEQPGAFQGPPDDLIKQVRDYLCKRLRSLPGDLGLAEESHFLCGISQIAVGADMQFTQACRSLEVPQRIFLPQPRDVYLKAVGTDGLPDFSPEEQAEAQSLLSSPHIVQELVVSNAPDRQTRFEDVSSEILRESDAIVCLLREDAISKPGGTAEMLELAKSRGIPVLEIRVALRDGNACFEERWNGRERFKPPALPKEVANIVLPRTDDGMCLPDVAEYCHVLKEHASSRARRYSGRFFGAAITVIVMHFVATLLATLALMGHQHDWPHLAIGWLLSIEFLLLALGLVCHFCLHRYHLAKIWAISRLLAEINRSVRSLGHLQLGYLFRLQLPADLVPLLRTLSILHLWSTRKSAKESWQATRDKYLQVRLRDPSRKKGQIAYYRYHRDIAGWWLKFVNGTFLTCSVMAVGATASKLGLLVLVTGEGHMPKLWKLSTPDILGLLAIFLPLIAVGILSWAAAMDYEARGQTYRQMYEFLKDQELRIQQATSSRELEQLVDETETRLLGETAAWYSRRSFASVV